MLVAVRVGAPAGLPRGDPYHTAVGPSAGRSGFFPAPALLGASAVPKTGSPLSGPVRKPALLAGQESLPQPPGAALDRFAALAVPARLPHGRDRR
jgi:hypothetical protein